MLPTEEYPPDYTNLQRISNREGRRSERRHQHPEISDPIRGMLIDDNSEAIRVMIDARDRTGIISCVSDIARKHRINIRNSNSFRMEELFSEIVLIIEGSPENVKLFEHDLKRIESESISGKQILPAKLFDLRIECQDRIGMLYDISSTLRDHDINIVTMGIRTIAEDLIENDDIDKSKWRAFIHMRIEVPQEQLKRMDEIQQRLREIDSVRELSMNQWTPKKKSGPSGSRWPFEYN